jgi:hypothetical protein
MRPWRGSVRERLLVDARGVADAVRVAHRLTWAQRMMPVR